MNRYVDRMRLHKYMSQCGIASRRKAEKLIKAGEVRVNGQVVREAGVQIDPAKDVVELGKQRIKACPKGIILFNKPAGVVSTLSDPEGRRTVADYITRHYRSYFPVGRLDFESTGLIVLTNDGELAELLLHPRYGFERMYELMVRGRMPDAVLARMERGVKLEDGIIKGRVNLIQRSEHSTKLTFAIRVGRNRVIRRMMERLSYPVISLKRLSHGPFKLGRLKAGQVRKLSEKENRFFRARILKAAERASRNIA